VIKLTKWTQAINGIPSCANSYLQETILREHWVSILMVVDHGLCPRHMLTLPPIAS